jgi:hypothetical protein
MSIKEDFGPEHLLQQADEDGISVTSVNDGHMFVFTKKNVENLLKVMADANSDKCMVFVRQPVPGTGN